MLLSSSRGRSDAIDDSALAGDLTYYSGAEKRDLTKPGCRVIVSRNHQRQRKAYGCEGAEPVPFIPKELRKASSSQRSHSGGHKRGCRGQKSS